MTSFSLSLFFFFNCSTSTTSSDSNSITGVEVGCSSSFPKAGIMVEVMVDLGTEEVELELRGGRAMLGGGEERKDSIPC